MDVKVKDCFDLYFSNSIILAAVGPEPEPTSQPEPTDLQPEPTRRITSEITRMFNHHILFGYIRLHTISEAKL